MSDFDDEWCKAYAPAPWEEITRLRARVADLEDGVVHDAKLIESLRAALAEAEQAIGRLTMRVNELRPEVARAERAEAELAATRLTLDQVATEAATDKAALAEAWELIECGVETVKKYSRVGYHKAGAEFLRSASAFLERTAPSQEAER